jgi:hypothetical protein
MCFHPDIGYNRTGDSQIMEHPGEGRMHMRGFFLRQRPVPQFKCIGTKAAALRWLAIFVTGCG